MKIVIIGGGASGMAAAIAAARQTPKPEVLILEQKDQPGKKILSTGNGRCNLTNEFMEPSCFHSDMPEGIPQLLAQFDTADTKRLFRELGLWFKSRNGYLYPRSDQAVSVRDALVRELTRLGVHIRLNTRVKELQKRKKGFLIVTDQTTEKADRVILAAGGRAAPVLGSDGSGYTLAKMLGHSIVPVVPSLVQLKVAQHPLAKAAGVRTDATVRALVDGKLLAEDTGELQITSYGISGIPVFQISRHLTKALYYKKQAQVVVDFLPDCAKGEVRTLLTKRRSICQEFPMDTFFMGIFPAKLAASLLAVSGISGKQITGRISDRQFETLLHCLTDLKLSITGDNGFENAQVCAGGVDLREINLKTMESRCTKGLYLCGELIDIDGLCGGYALQICWGTGYTAGRNSSVF